MAGYTVSTRELKNGKTTTTVYIDYSKITPEEKQLIQDFYIPAGATVKVKGKGLTKVAMLEYIEKYAPEKLDEYNGKFAKIKETKDKKKNNFMTVRKDFKADFPNYPKKP